MTSGMSIEIGWPSMAASASMPPTPQPSTDSPLTIVVWLSVPTSVSGKAYSTLFFPSLIFARPHRLREIFQIDLMADAGARRHDAEIRKRLLAPAQERIALLVALIFDDDVLLEGILCAEIIDHHRMVDDEIDFGERIDLFGIAAERLHRIAHRGEIDHRRHAGQVLHQHARGPERDFAIRGFLLQPAGHRLDVGLRDRTRRLRSAADSPAAPSANRAASKCP